MSQSDLDQLVDQLYVEDAKMRRNAAKRLGESGKPEYIAELVNVYMKDADAAVRKTAEDALRQFRRMEQAMIEGIDPEDAPAGDVTPILKTVRLLLGFLLIILLLVNAAIFVPRLIPPPVVVVPTQAGPSVRSSLVDGLSKRIKQVGDDAATLRKLFSTIQGGMGLLGINKDQCQTLQNEPLDAVDFGSVDSVYYPDLKTVSDLLNTATPKIGVVRNDYLKLCAAKTQQDFDNQVSLLGGAGAEVTAIDDATNKYLADADVHLKKAIANPAPTITMTYTPVPTLTPTIPTATPTFTPSVTPTPGPTSAATSVPTGAASGAGTSAATQQAAVADTYTFSGLMLDGLTSYKYRVQATTNGTLTNNKAFHGNLQVNTDRQTNPVEAEYDVNLSEGLANITFFKPYLGGLYVAGASTFIVVNDNLYETGNVLDVPKFNGRCRITKLPAGTLPSKVQDVTFADLSGIVVKAKSQDVSIINGVNVLHYTGERNIGDNKEFKQTLDIYVSADKHIPISLTETQTLDKTIKSNSGLKDYTFNLTYDLTGSGVALDIVQPITCQAPK